MVEGKGSEGGVGGDTVTKTWSLVDNWRRILSVGPTNSAQLGRWELQLPRSWGSPQDAGGGERVTQLRRLPSTLCWSTLEKTWPTKYLSAQRRNIYWLSSFKRLRLWLNRNAPSSLVPLDSDKQAYKEHNLFFSRGTYLLPSKAVVLISDFLSLKHWRHVLLDWTKRTT